MSDCVEVFWPPLMATPSRALGRGWVRKAQRRYPLDRQPFAEHSCFPCALQGGEHDTLQLSRIGLFTGQLCDHAHGNTGKRSKRPRGPIAVNGTVSDERDLNKECPA